MIDAIWLSNLLRYSVQIAALAAIAAAAAALCRIDAPGVRYAYWRIVGLLCLALPWLQPRIAKTAADTGQAGSVLDAAAAFTIGGTVATDGASAVNPMSVALAILAAGLVLRLAWLTAGLVKLRRLRRAPASCGPRADYDELQHTLGTRADIRYVEALQQPVTFGLLRPVVLLPSTLRKHPERVRRAVVAHELLHVQRRDWAWVLLEEAVRALFWFHPGVWWLVSKVQLAREEAVDELAVLVTGQRRTYVEALLAFADESPLAPAPAFARRRHLFRRMMLISKEAVMSPKQIVGSCAVMAAMVAAGSWYAVRAFPMAVAAQEMSFSPRPDGRGPLERQAVLITPENPIPRRISVVNADYPAEARAAEVTARVSIQITLDAQGRVAESRLVGLDLYGATPRARGGSADGMDVTRGDFEPSVADAFTEAALGAVRQWRYDPPYQAPISFPVTISFLLGATKDQAGMPPPPPPPPPAPARVGARLVTTPEKTRHVDPVYPSVALAANVQGVVLIEARVGADGRVEDARVLRSIPLLDASALTAVRQWEFKPVLLNGAPVPVTVTLPVHFSLSRDR